MYYVFWNQPFQSNFEKCIISNYFLKQIYTYHFEKTQDWKSNLYIYQKIKESNVYSKLKSWSWLTWKQHFVWWLKGVLGNLPEMAGF